MSRFIAFPVHAGDAFHLQRSGFSVLVDGGKSRSGFPGMFRARVRRNDFDVDVMVCTHNDADHANGIIGALEEGIRCREVWLPGRWLGVLNDVFRPVETVVRDIVAGAREYLLGGSAVEPRPSRSLEEVGQALHREMETDGELLRSEEVFDWPEEVVEALEDADTWDAPFVSRRGWGWLRVWYLLEVPGGPDRMVIEALEAAERIRQIALLAYSNGIPVRWFAHDSAAYSPVRPNHLHVVGATQIARVRPLGTFFERLALTTVNKEGLVLYSPADPRSPGVLFCGDSDLFGMHPRLRPDDLVTVPHHGAEANRGAYAVIANAVGGDSSSLTWVRSDSRSRHRPGPTFLQEKGRKFCTICKGGSSKQAIVFHAAGGHWLTLPDRTGCTC
jgi:hypothetical protein